MKKIVTLGVASLAVVGAVGMYSLSASAMTGNGTGTRPQDGTGLKASSGAGYGRQTSLEARARIVGMTADELEKALETKTFSEIAKEKGMTQADFQAKMEAAAKARWEARGLSSDEIAQRIADREKRQAANAADHEWGSGDGDHMGGYGRNR